MSEAIIKRRQLAESNAKLRQFTPWLAFVFLFGCGWRVFDLVHNIPAYGDTLEVIWGFEWYYEALFVRHVSPFFSPLVFHPQGWQTASLAHTPLLFVLGALGIALGGSAALSYNLAVIASLLLAFRGGQRFFRNYVDEFATTVAALVFTFMGMRWWRIEGHLHILFATSLLPWFLHYVLQCLKPANHENRPPITRNIVFAGLCWGLMINFSLYSLFLGAVAMAIGGRRWLYRRQLLTLLAITALALLFSAPLLWLYFQATQIEMAEKQGITALLLRWGASFDSLLIPNRQHPLPLVRQLAQALYQGPFDESGSMNIGLLSWLLALLGLLGAWRNRQRQFWGLVWLALAGLTMSLGILLRWNGVFLNTPALTTLDKILWQWGHALKPALFESAEPPIFFDQGIPLPAYLLAILIPFWDSARVLARYAYVGSLGILGLAALGVQGLRTPLRWFVVALWLIEALPTVLGNVPLPQQPHPAHAWLAQQTVPAAEGIVDLLADPAQMMAGEIVYATRFHHLPTVAGVGSFVPRQLHFIQKWLFADTNALSKPETAYLLLGYGARYALFHVRQPEDWASWEKLKTNSAVRPLQCFNPVDKISPWNYPICVAELINPPLWGTINAVLDEGWSGTEAWGVWAEGRQSSARWVATRPADQKLQIKAFPYCPATPPEQAQEQAHQTLAIWANGQSIGNHDWQACEEWQNEVTIPAQAVIVGWNQLEFRYGYAISPAGDSRQLSVGFSQIQITPSQ